MEPLPRIIIPGIAARPAGFTRHVAWLADARFRRSSRDVPMACLGERSVTYFGKGNFWALFENYRRVGKVTNPVTAALWLRGES